MLALKEANRMVSAMVICFNADITAKKALDELMNSGEFRDTSEAVAMALINYAVLQGSFKAGGDTGMETHFPKPAPEPEQQTTGVAAGRSSAPENKNRVPELFSLKSSAEKRPEVAKRQLAPSTRELSPKDWLWGQYNRFLPAKATCRALLNLLKQKPGGVPIQEASSQISYAACGLGDFLTEMDLRSGRRREDAIASAFPTSSISGGESRRRFGQQFVGAFKQGKLTGLPASLRLIAPCDSKDERLSLTEEGLAFALLSSPILDGKSGSVKKFSEEEMLFLLNHIKATVPEEVDAFTAIIDGIIEGANTPEQLDQYLCRRYKLTVAEKAETPGEITGTFLTTQRTGAISRMVDLDFVFRTKKGLHVTYEISHPGKLFRTQLPRS